MNRSNLLIATLLAIIVLFSCSHSNEKNSPENTAMVENNFQESSSKNQNKRAIKYFPIKDMQQNMLMAVMPIPIDWSLSNNKKETIFFESSKGVKTFYALGNQFMYYQNSYINDSFCQMGFETKPPQSFEQVLEELKGYAKKEGATLTKQYELPQLIQSDKNLDRLLFKSHPEQKTVRVVATEWIDIG